MGALKWVVCISLVLMISVGSILEAKDIDRKYGIELRGGYGLYLDNTDPNSFVKGFADVPGYTMKEYTESTGALSGGISLLYKTEDYFAWHIGLNVFGSDSATAKALNANNQVQTGRVYMNVVELFLTANYYWRVTPRFDLQFGAGPAFYLASLDKEVSQGAVTAHGDSFYGAHGRSFGFIGALGGEFFLSDVLAIKLGGGYRFASISRFKYYREITGPSGIYKQGEIAYWPDTFDTFQVDFSGLFAEIGLRIYFEPAAKWKQYGD